MSTSDEHNKQVASNLKVAADLSVLKEVPYDWMVTVYFYAAVHLIEKELSDKGVHSTNHCDRFRNVREHLRLVYSKYQALYNDSLVARYDCVAITEGKADNAKKNLEIIKHQLQNKK